MGLELEHRVWDPGEETARRKGSGERRWKWEDENIWGCVIS
jgi:hypothetical protein